MSERFVKSNGEDYAFTKYLMRQGWDRHLARRIGASTGIELEKDIIFVEKKDIDCFDYLSSEEKENLWQLVCEEWCELSVERREEALADEKDETHREMIKIMLFGEDSAEQKMRELAHRMFDMIEKFPKQEGWVQELMSGLKSHRNSHPASSVFGAFEQLNGGDGRAEILKFGGKLWWHTDPSRERNNSFHILKFITKWKWIHQDERLNELENVVREFNGIFCKYELRRLRKQEDKLLDDLHNSKSEQFRNALEINDLRERLHKEQKKCKQLQNLLWTAERPDYTRREHLEKMLLELKSMGEVTDVMCFK